MVVAILLDALFPPDKNITNDTSSRSDNSEELHLPMRHKKTIQLLGIETEVDALFNSFLEDLNFCIDWVYVDWVFGNRCSSKKFKGAVLGLALLATVMYLIHASNVLKRVANMRFCLPCCCGSKSNISKRIYVFLMMLVVLEGIPQIAVTVSFHFAVVANDSNDCAGFAAQAASNLLTSSLVVLRRLLKIYEYHSIEKQKQSFREVASLDDNKDTEKIPPVEKIPEDETMLRAEMPQEESTGPSGSDDPADIEEAVHKRPTKPPRPPSHHRRIPTNLPPRRPFTSKAMRSETM